MSRFEFLLPGRPVSQQARRRERVREWKAFVNEEARRQWTGRHQPADAPVSITLLCFYDEVALDVDNILKPIQDALIGIVFRDDSLVTDAIVRRRQLGGKFDLTDAPLVLIQGFHQGGEFVYVRVSDSPQEQIL
jgi:crossover junction endodeoxyribonuclease RusA